MGLGSQENDYRIQSISVRLKVLLLHKCITHTDNKTTKGHARLLFHNQNGYMLILSGQSFASSCYVKIATSFTSTSHKVVSLESREPQFAISLLKGYL